MIIQLYKNLSSNNTINKQIELLKEVNCNIPNNVDIVRPNFIINGFYKFNYCYIEKFNRYYYCDTEYDKNRTIVKCKSDVLMSFKNEFLNTQQIIKKSSSSFNRYLHDDNMTLLANNLVVTKKFPNEIPDNNYNILVVLGS